MTDETARLETAWTDVFGTKQKHYAALSRMGAELKKEIPPSVAINALGYMKSKGIGPSYPYLRSTVASLMNARMHENLESDERRRRSEPTVVSPVGCFIAVLMGPEDGETKVENLIGLILEEYGETTVKRVLKRMSEERRQKQ